jgi:hypothetical protein
MGLRASPPNSLTVPLRAARARARLCASVCAWVRARRSKFFLDGALMINNEGLHGMVERCETRTIAAGNHIAYVEGFQAGGGVGMELRYSGPDTAGKRVFMRSGGSPITLSKAGGYFKQCDPAPAVASKAFTMCMFRSEVGITTIPTMADADTGMNRLYYIGQGTMPTVNLRDLNIFRSVVPNIPDRDYAWTIYGNIRITTPGSYDLCITSDDGARLFVDGALLVDNDGLHGPVEKCGSLDLTKGPHIIYIEGFQAWGGVHMEATYFGPDTGEGKVLMMCGKASSRYFPQCDPTDAAAAGDPNLFTMCMFGSTAGALRAVPRVGDAVSAGTLKFLGKGQLAVVDMHDLSNFRQIAPNTPETDYAWVIYGKLQVVKAGTYNLCVSSDDG